jgi:hypothetical protein
MMVGNTALRIYNCAAQIQQAFGNCSKNLFSSRFLEVKTHRHNKNNHNLEQNLTEIAGFTEEERIKSIARKREERSCNDS